MGGILDNRFWTKAIPLCPAFTTALIFREHAVSTDSLSESLLLYLSLCKIELMTTALQEDLDGDGQD